VESKPVRLIDLARASGVSIATASQVMNGSGRVAPATRQRVLETAQRLDYRPNALARSVASGRSNTVGILAENASGAFCMPVLVGANRALSEVELASTLFDAAHDRRRRRDHVRQLQARHVDGVLVIGEGTDFRSTSVTHEFPGPVVYALSRSDDPDDICVLPDDAHAGRLAAEHLAERGRTRLVHVTAQSHLDSVRDRERGLRSGLAGTAAQLIAPPLHGEFSREWGFQAARRLLDDGVDFDAVFAGNDEIAVGLAAALLSAGRRIPDDVAIVGVDNSESQTGRSDNYLTSIDPRFDAVGTAAIAAVAAMLDGSETPRGPIVVPGALAVGRSTVAGPPDGRDRMLESLLS
jgi:LacI family transcriptional regulator